MKNKNIVIPIALFGSVVMLLVSCGEQSKGWKGIIEEVDGITVVKNPREPMYGKEVFSIEEDLKIGEIEGDENYMFNVIVYLAVDNEGNIYVADFGEKHIKAFDANGEFLRVLGRAGQGPGEFGAIRDIHINAKNELMVTDLRHREILYFSHDGEFIRSMDLKVIIGGIRGMWSTGSWQLYSDSNENFYIRAAIVDYPRIHFELYKIDVDKNRLTTIAKTLEWNANEVLNPDRPGLLYCRVMHNGCLLYGYPRTYKLQIFNPEGKILKKIIRDYDPVQLTEEEEAEKEERRKTAGKKTKFPPVHPAFSYLAVDDEGRIYVRTWEKLDNGEGYFFDIFDHEGKYIARIPFNFRPQELKKGKMYSIEEDEEGYQFVKRYKVNWKY
jgi:hypothetical protein